MYYTIYKITNIINGKIYIGKHETENPDDNYMGSGKAIKNSIKKHGKESFVKDLLFVFNSVDEMNDKEKELVTENFVARKDTYNLGVGGEGGPHFKNRKHSEATKQKIREKSKGHVHSLETRRKISEANRKRIITDEFRKKMSKIATGRKKSEEEKKKISETMKKHTIKAD